MYIVICKGLTTNVRKFEYLDEAQEFMKELARAGFKDISLSKEIPFKLKIDVEFYEEV